MPWSVGQPTLAHIHSTNPVINDCSLIASCLVASSFSSPRRKSIIWVRGVEHTHLPRIKTPQKAENNSYHQLKPPSHPLSPFISTQASRGNAKVRPCHTRPRTRQTQSTQECRKKARFPEKSRWCRLFPRNLSRKECDTLLPDRFFADYEAAYWQRDDDVCPHPVDQNKDPRHPPTKNETTSSRNNQFQRRKKRKKNLM